MKMDKLNKSDIENIYDEINKSIVFLNLVKINFEKVQVILKHLLPLVENKVSSNDKKYKLSDNFVNFLENIEHENTYELIDFNTFISILKEYIELNNLIDNKYIKIDEKLKIIIPNKKKILINDLMSETKLCLISLNKKEVNTNTEKFLKNINYDKKIIEKQVLAQLILDYIYKNNLYDNNNNFKLDDNLKLLFKKTFPLNEMLENVKSLMIKNK
jgi:hypothetical protein